MYAIYAPAARSARSPSVERLLFSTKDRTPFLTLDVRPDLHAYLATVARHGDGECYRAGGVANHVHLAIRLSRTISIAGLVSELKTSSSKWLKDRSPALDGVSPHGFTSDLTRHLGVLEF